MNNPELYTEYMTRWIAQEVDTPLSKMQGLIGSIAQFLLVARSTDITSESGLRFLMATERFVLHLAWDLGYDEISDFQKNQLLSAANELSYVVSVLEISSAPKDARFFDAIRRAASDLISVSASLQSVSTYNFSPENTESKEQKGKRSMDVNTLIAAISALIDAITLWRSARDRKESAEALQREFHKVKKISTPEAVALGNLVPADLLDTMCERVYDCFKKYQQILENDKDYFPEDIDGATDTVIYCVCRELNRIYKLNLNIPPGKLSEWWNGYRCFTKLN